MRVLVARELREAAADPIGVPSVHEVLSGEFGKSRVVERVLYVLERKRELKNLGVYTQSISYVATLDSYELTGHGRGSRRGRDGCCQCGKRSK